MKFFTYTIFNLIIIFYKKIIFDRRDTHDLVTFARQVLPLCYLILTITLFWWETKIYHTVSEDMSLHTTLRLVFIISGKGLSIRHALLFLLTWKHSRHTNIALYVYIYIHTHTGKSKSKLHGALETKLINISWKSPFYLKI